MFLKAIFLAGRIQQLLKMEYLIPLGILAENKQHLGIGQTCKNWLINHLIIKPAKR
jgi:hypothetical protein